MEQRIGIERMEETINLFGSFDENIRLLESEFQVTVVNRGGELVISGEPENVMLAEKAVQALLTLSAKGESISEQHVRYVIGLCRSGQSERIGEMLAHRGDVGRKARRLRQNSRVDIGDGKAVFGKQRSDVSEQPEAVRPGVLRVRVREKLADIAERRRAEQGVHDRVGQNVRVRVTEQSLFKSELLAAQNEPPPLHEAVDVVAVADADVAHTHPSPRRFKIAAATARSAGVVSLTFSSLPRLKWTGTPSASAAAQSSV